MYRRLFQLAIPAMYVIVVSLSLPRPAYAMHIMEGFLPLEWAGLWFLMVIPFWVAGLLAVKAKVEGNPSLKLLLGLAGAFAFVLSALKLPSVTGSCSHPTGVGLGAILFGPAVMSLLGAIVLLFQALLLAHGGLTTLGANAFSMAVVGPLVSYGIYRFLRKGKAPLWLATFLAAALGNLSTYVTTAFQLALAFPAEQGGISASLVKFMAVFAVTQVPLAVIEGLLTVAVFNFLVAYNKEELKDLAVLS
ncbi:MAG: Cobalt transport protein CbiM [Moorella sp. 60_41]|nr:MAG: Cobalt transport protein CbiM [Moorella sp. 60_41]